MNVHVANLQASILMVYLFETDINQIRHLELPADDSRWKYTLTTDPTGKFLLKKKENALKMDTSGIFLFGTVKTKLLQPNQVVIIVYDYNWQLIT
jgi:hypothetical protein